MNIDKIVNSVLLIDSDKLLLSSACDVLTGNILHATEYPWYPFRGICPSLDEPFRGIWNWDSAFHALAVSRFAPALSREQITMWFSLQLPSGELPDVLMEDGLLEDTYGKPPVMPWAAMVVDKRQPNDEFAALCYKAFLKFENHWRVSRSTPGGLFFYDSRAADPARRETETRWESGWDNSVRWDKGINRLNPVDLACYMVMLYSALEYFAERVGDRSSISLWQERRRSVSSAINKDLWNPEMGTWLDMDRFTGELSHVITPACFMPLFIGIASEEQAESCLKLLMSPSDFFPGMPTVSYGSPQFDRFGYWRGRTWLNVAWFALKGFRRYGYLAETDMFKETLLGWCRDSGIRENYDSLSGKGLGASNFGWSAAFVIEFLLNWNEDGSCYE